MAPTNKQQQQNIEPEEILQAVVVADSFDQQFMPLTADLPRCLLPLCNVPLIEYTLEFLAVADVKEVFIVCCAHSQKIKEYILASQWSEETSPMRVHVIVSRSSMSMGDVLRELDTKSLIKSDFVLVNGDVISNLKLDSVLAAHRERKATDKNTIMTMVLKEGSAYHGARGPHAVFCLEPGTTKCLQYVHLDRADARELHINPEVLDAHKDLMLRNDLIDCGIDICSIEVLALFSENFDYQDIRRDFVRGILESDLFVKSIYGHVIHDEYAVRVRNTQLYDRISLDMMRRWTYPLVPDANALGTPGDLANFTHSRGNIYREKPVFLSRTTSLVGNVVLGRNSAVGQGTVLTNCVVGRDCKIGRNVRLANAYLWDGCSVGDGVVVEHAILARNAAVRDRVTLARGCILGQGVVVGADTAVPPHTRIERPAAGEPSDAELVGADGVGVKSEADDYDEDDDEAEDPVLRAMIHDLGFSADDLRRHLDAVALRQADESDDEDGSDAGSDAEDNAEEIRATINRALAQGHTLDNALLELNTLKFACNLTFKDLRDEVGPCILHHVFVANNRNFKALLERWVGVWAGLVHAHDDQVDLVTSTAAWFAAHAAEKAKYMSTVAMVMYEADVVEEDAFLAWYHSDADNGEPGMPAVKKAMKAFVEWLEEDDEDEEESEEESDDE
ncbi:translation initiation factor eIF-2B epsilon subunit, GEF [Blastocladiella emersonii ATCC 22665]|nr:translation initiation factor eIF-2B epsilon subunit, GEF [Blastocladiella emersonii ATCC 22665]